MRTSASQIRKNKIYQMTAKKYADYGFVTQLDVNEEDNIQVKSVVDVLSHQYQVNLEFDHEENLIASTCSCSDSNCIHIGTVMEKLQSVVNIPYHNQIDLKKEIKEEKKRSLERKENAEIVALTQIGRDLLKDRKMTYQKQIDRFLANEKYELEASLVSDYGNLMLSYKVGNDKKYVVKHISHFLNMIRNQEIYRYGKQLEMNHDLNSFDEFSQKQIQLLEEIERNLKPKYYSNYPSEITRHLEVTEENIDKIFDVYEGYDDSNFRCLKDEQKITLRWVEKEKYDMIESLTDIHDFIYGQKHLYKVDHKKMKYWITRLQLDESGHAIQIIESLIKGPIYIKKDERSEFYKYVFSDLLDYFEILNLPEFEFAQIEKIRIFGDINDEGNVSFKIDYIHSNQKHTKGFSDENVLNYKQDLVENYIQRYSTYIDEHVAVFDSNDEKTLTFLEEGFPFLQEYADIYISDNLKRFNEHKNYSISIGVRYESDLLNLEINSIDLPKEELSQILAQYRKKKKFFRLKSGELIHLNSGSIEELNELVDDYHLDLNDLDKGTIQLDPYRMFSIDDDADTFKHLQFERENSFKKTLKKFKGLSLEEQTIPAHYETILRDYQKDGVKWLKLLRQYGFNGILADDMGLGKTLQVITLIEDMKSECPTLVVAPSSLVYNWADEVNKFSKEIKAICVVGNQENRKKLLQEKANLLITSYDYVRRDVELYEEMMFEYVILDEAQYIKNQKTQNAISVKKLKAKHRLALTGTPIENSLAELWSIFDFLMPNYLYNYHYFLTHYENDIVRNDDENKKAKLKQLVTPFILRRNKKEVLKELPDKIEKVQLIDFNEEENKLYLAHLAQVNKELNAMMKSDSMDKVAILAMMMKLRQICCEPRLLFDNIEHSSSKMRACIELVKTLKANNQRVLIFSAFTSVLSLIEEELSTLDISYYKLTGQTSKEERRKLIQKFQNDDTSVFLISLKAGGTGLNLTAAQSVIHYDPWWNVSAQNQATDRTHRIGQEKNVQVFKLVIKNSIEEKIMKLQEKKKDLADTFIEGNEGSIAKMDKKDILNLFKI